MNIEIVKAEKKEQKTDFAPGVYAHTKDRSFIVWFTEKKRSEFIGTVVSTSDMAKGNPDYYQVGGPYSCCCVTFNMFELFDGKIILSN